MGDTMISSRTCCSFIIIRNSNISHVISLMVPPADTLHNIQIEVWCNIYYSHIFIFHSLNYFIYLLLEKGKGGRKRGTNFDMWEKHRLVASRMSPTGDLASNPGTCLDWESNRQPFGLQAGTQSTEPHQPELTNVLSQNPEVACITFAYTALSRIASFTSIYNEGWEV